MSSSAFLATLIILGAPAVNQMTTPLHLAASHEGGHSVVLLEMTVGSKSSGRYSLEVSDGLGNRSQTSGRFDASHPGPFATIVLASKAHAHLLVTLDDGRTYEQEWPSAL